MKSILFTTMSSTMSSKENEPLFGDFSFIRRIQQIVHFPISIYSDLYRIILLKKHLNSMENCKRYLHRSSLQSQIKDSQKMELGILLRDGIRFYDKMANVVKENSYFFFIISVSRRINVCAYGGAYILIYKSMYVHLCLYVKTCFYNMCNVCVFQI